MAEDYLCVVLKKMRNVAVDEMLPPMTRFPLQMGTTTSKQEEQCSSKQGTATDMG